MKQRLYHLLGSPFTMTELCARTRSCIEDDYEDDQAGRHIRSPNQKILRGKAVQSAVVYGFSVHFRPIAQPRTLPSGGA